MVLNIIEGEKYSFSIKKREDSEGHVEFILHTLAPLSEEQIRTSVTNYKGYDCPEI
jgi:hypothetical protein